MFIRPCVLSYSCVFFHALALPLVPSVVSKTSPNTKPVHVKFTFEF